MNYENVIFFSLIRYLKAMKWSWVNYDLFEPFNMPHVWRVYIGTPLNWPIPQLEATSQTTPAAWWGWEPLCPVNFPWNQSVVKWRPDFAFRYLTWGSSSSQVQNTWPWPRGGEGEAEAPSSNTKSADCCVKKIWPAASAYTDKIIQIGCRNLLIGILHLLCQAVPNLL